MTKIKICGLSRRQDIEFVNRLLPDYIGFVFAEMSRRCIKRETAAELKRELSPSISTVGVFVDEDIYTVAELASGGILDIVQLHGDEDEGYILKLKQMIKKPVIKAFRVKSDKEIAAAQKSRADYVLLDSGAGSGKTFDRTLLKGIKRPYFLAGGLTPENVREAINFYRPFAVDVSSGVETDNVKDQNKIEKFIYAARRESVL